MQKTSIILISYILISGSFPVYAQDDKQEENISITGILMSAEDSTPIPDASVIDISANYGVITDKDGRFIIQVKKTDTILFSVVGFKNLKLKFSDQKDKDHFYKIYLNVKIYDISGVKIYPYKTYEEFKQAFIKLKIPEKDSILNLNLPKYYGNNGGSGGFGVTINGPITAVYNVIHGAFSKEGRSEHIFDKFTERENHEKFIERKYNKDIVKNVTKLNTDEEIKQFMDFCNISDNFVQTSSNYDIIKAIYECYNEYKLKNK